MSERHEKPIYVNPARCYGGARLLLQFPSGLPTISELEVEISGKVVDGVAVRDDRTILCLAPDDEPGAKDVVVMSGKREIIRQDVAVEHSGESRSGEAKPESGAELNADASSSLEKPGDPTRPASNWWMLHQDLEHSGDARADTVVPLQKLWEQTFQAALHTSQPIVGDGAVLVGIFGNGGESFAALDEETGQRRWVRESEKAVWGDPVAVNGLVYFIESDLGGSELICLRIADGSVVWSNPLPTGAHQGALAAAFGYIYSLTRFGTLAAYTASTGTLAWQVSVDVGSGSTLSSPAIGFGNVYVGTAQGLRAFDAVTGAPKWAASGSLSNGNATPLIVSDVGVGNPAVVAIGSTDQTLRGYHATNGSLLWEFVGDLPLWYTTPATDSGKIYVRQSKTIVELDVVAGTVTATSPDLGADVASAPTMTKSRLITIMSDDRIVALNRPGLSVDAEVGIPAHPDGDSGRLSVEGSHLYVNVAASDPWPAPRDTVHAYHKRSNCLIATAAYGSPLAQEVQFLCDVRDKRLRKSHLGNLFVDAFESVYYKFSPYIAENMRRNPWFKVAMRWIVVAPVVRTLKVIAAVAGLTGDLTKRKP